MSSISRLLVMLCLASTQLIAEEQVAIPVSSKPLSELLIYPQHSAPATVISLNDSQISAQIAAEIKSVAVQVGDKVLAGQKLVVLDCEDSQLNLRHSKAALSLTEKELARARSLAKSNNLSAQQLSQRRTEHTQAQVAWKQTNLQVRRCTVLAPFTGVITKRLASEGELATPGTPLLQLLDTKRLEISAHLPANDADKLATIKNLQLRANHQSWPLKFRTALPLVNTSARTREARFIFADKPTLPGTAGRLHWQSTQETIPADMLVQRDDKIGVFLRDGDKAKFHALKNAQIGHPAPIDLPMDAAIIIDGRFALKNNDLITITP